MRKTVFLFLLVIQALSICYGNNRSYYENLLKSAIQESNNRNYVKALEYFMTVKVYAIENSLFEVQTNTLINMGVAYYAILDYEKAMECYLEAYQIIVEESKNKKEEIRILNNIAALYITSNNLDKAAEYLDKAYNMAIEIKYTSIKTLVSLLANMGAVSNKQGNLVQAKKYIKTAMEMLKDNPKDYLFEYFTIQCLKIEYLYFSKEYDLAEQLALETLTQDIEKVDQELEVECLLLLSKIYHQKKNVSKAISFAKDALEESFKLPMTIEIYNHLSEVYRATNSLSLVVQCQDSIIKIKNSLTELNDINKILSGQIQFDLNNLEKKMAENKEKNKRNQLIFVFVIIFIIALFLLILYVRSLKNKQLKITTKFELEKEKNEKLLLEQQFKERETLALVEEMMYKNEIELKNKQLISQTLFQLSKNELMEEIIQDITHIPTLSKAAEMQPIIQKLESQLKEPAGADWNSFLTYFEQTNPVFLTNLKEKHPDLAASDIRLASYIYLNLDTKEISKLLNITPEYCMKKKQRLAHKLNLPSVKIYSYLASINND